MYLAIKDVKPQSDYKLLLTFENEEVKVFDVSEYLKIGKFSELKDIAVSKMDINSLEIIKKLGE